MMRAPVMAVMFAFELTNDTNACCRCWPLPWWRMVSWDARF
jgi:H+/Cl- antiporter ClcA